MRTIPLTIRVVGVAICFFQFGCERQVYPIGRDTVKSFGNGRFQILRGGYEKAYHLSDLEPLGGKRIVSKIKDWRSDRGWVYVISKEDEYTILNYRTGSFETYKEIQDAPPEHRTQLEKLEK